MAQRRPFPVSQTLWNFTTFHVCLGASTVNQANVCTTCAILLTLLGMLEFQGDQSETCPKEHNVDELLSFYDQLYQHNGSFPVTVENQLPNSDASHYNNYPGIIQTDQFSHVPQTQSLNWFPHGAPYGIGPYDIIEMKVTSLHDIPGYGESCRTIGIAAGESLHNIYRVIMTSLNQREVQDYSER